jgi:hypothetical protein
MALARQDLEVPQPTDIPRFYENPSRSFISDELRNHVLAIPQPFAVSVRWLAIQFYPGCIASQRPEMQLRLVREAWGRHQLVHRLVCHGRTVLLRLHGSGANQPVFPKGQTVQLRYF